MGFLTPEGANIESEGPRVEQLSYSDSAFGLDIPKAYGTVRLGGNIIWLGNLVERTTTTSTTSGGKGGGGESTQTTTHYFYYLSFAVAFGEGVATDVLRIWANGNIIFDKVNQTSGRIKKNTLNFRFYSGGESQLPDSIIQSAMGDNAPAFRGLCYIVFDNLWVGQFGNRMPTITAEINFREEASGLIKTQSASFPIMPATWLSYDRKRHRLYGHDNGTEISAFDLGGLSRVGVLEWHRPILTFDRTGWILAADTAGSSKPVLLNGFTGAVLNENASVTIGGTYISGVDMVAYTDRGAYDLALYRDVDGSNIIFSTLTVSPFTTREMVQTEGILSAASATNNYFGLCKSDNGADAFCGFISSTTLTIYRMETTIEVVGGVYIPKLKDPIEIASLSPSDIISGASSFTGGHDIYTVYYDSASSIFFGVEIDSAYYIVDVSRGGVVRGSLAVPFIRDNLVGEGDSVITNGYWGYHNGANKIIKINLSTFKISDIYNGVDTFVTLGYKGQVWSDDDNSIYNYNSQTGTVLYKLTLNTGASDPVEVADIVNDMAERVNLNRYGDIDTTTLTDTVDGYLISNRMTVKEALKPLGELYFIDLVERDGKITYVKRGATPSITITEDDFIRQTTEGNYKETRTQESELPAVYNIRYIDSGNDYQPNTVSVKRVQSPDSAILSDNKVTFDIPISTSADTAKKKAESQLYTLWLERTKYDFNLGTKYIYLDPTDVCTFTLNNGYSFQGRFNNLDIGRDYSGECGIVKENNGQYSSTATADGGSVDVEQIPTLYPTQAFLIDSPLLRDNHALLATGLRAYFGGNTAGAGDWGGCVVSKSTDGSTWNDILESRTGVAWGVCATTLGNTDSHWRTDDVNTLDIQMVSGGDELSSITELQMLNGGNPALLIKHNGEVAIIQFQNVTDLGDDLYRIDTLLRGRRGTNTMDVDYTGGEYFLFLGNNDITGFGLFLEDLNLQRSYRAVTIGQFFDEAEEIPFTHTGRDQKPYSPVNLTATNDMSNNIDFAWQRRTRIGGETDLGDGGDGTVPLSETTEAYEMDIYFSGAIIRTVTGITTNSYEYTAADQTTDGFTAGSVATIQVDIYQISETVGRGFAGAFNIEVN